MPGVQGQRIGIHSADAVAYPRSIDRRDYALDYGATPCEEPHHFRCDELVHFTENTSAASIGLLEDDLFLFKAQPWRISSRTSLNLSWWSPLPHSSWQEQVDRNLPNIWNDFEDIGNSSALKGDSFCGSVGFAIKWEGILGQYASSRRILFDRVELRTLGTFRYRAEIMYAVLVCARG